MWSELAVMHGWFLNLLQQFVGPIVIANLYKTRGSKCIRRYLSWPDFDFGAIVSAVLLNCMCLNDQIQMPPQD